MILPAAVRWDHPGVCGCAGTVSNHSGLSKSGAVMSASRSSHQERVTYAVGSAVCSAVLTMLASAVCLPAAGPAMVQGMGKPGTP